MPADPVDDLKESQREQTRILRELSVAMAKVESAIASWHSADADQDKRLDDMEKRLDSLEETRTESRTALRVTWAFVGAIGSAVVWLLSR